MEVITQVENMAKEIDSIYIRNKQESADAPMKGKWRDDQVCKNSYH